MVRLHQGTVWCFTSFLVLWDLVAVLCPWGPLRYVMVTELQRIRNKAWLVAMVGRQIGAFSVVSRSVSR